jgi:hypothetical protein
MVLTILLMVKCPTHVDYHFDPIMCSKKERTYSNIKFYVSEYAASLESLVNAVAPEKLSIVVQVCFIMRMLMYLYLYFYMRMENLQGYFAPIAVKYANEHQDKLNHLILVNPPVSSFLELSIKFVGTEWS